VNPSDVFVLSWSFSQRAFDVDSLEDVLSRNFDVFRRHCGADYIPLGIYPTREAANDAYDEFRKWLPRSEGQTDESA